MAYSRNPTWVNGVTLITDATLENIETGLVAAAAAADTANTGLTGKANTSHTHGAADVASGVLAPARLGSGTAAAGKYVDGGTGAWTALPAGGAPRAGSAFIFPGAGRTGGWVNLMPMLAPSAKLPRKSASQVVFAPLHIPANVTFDKMSVNVTTAGAAGATIQVGIFNLDANGKPTTIVADTGALAATTTGVKEATISSTVVNAGTYGILAVTNDAAVLVTGWVYPDHYISSGAATPAGAFSSQYGLYVPTSGGWASDVSSYTWDRNDASNAGIPVLALHTTAVS